MRYSRLCVWITATFVHSLTFLYVKNFHKSKSFKRVVEDFGYEFYKMFVLKQNNKCNNNSYSIAHIFEEATNFLI